MTTTCSSMEIIQYSLILLMVQTSMQNETNPTMIQSVTKNEVIISYMMQPSTLILWEVRRNLQSLQIDNNIPIPWVHSRNEENMLIHKRVFMNLDFIQTRKIWYELHKNQRFLRLCPKKFEIELLQIHNPFIIFSPYHPSGEDELKWIDVSHNQSLEKEYVMSQFLNRMDDS